MKHEKLYYEAIIIAADAEKRFLDALEVNKSFNDRVLQENHFQIKVQHAASGACAQQDLIAELFEVPYATVHEDITRLIKGF